MTPLSLDEIARRQEARRESMGLYNWSNYDMQVTHAPRSTLTGHQDCIAAESDLSALLEMVREMRDGLKRIENVVCCRTGIWEGAEFECAPSSRAPSSRAPLSMTPWVKRRERE